MNKINAVFEKVSLDQYKKDMVSKFTTFTEEQIEEMYNNIVLPKRSTKRSAGYDFCTPMPVKLLQGESIVIPTGIRFKCPDEYYLEIVPRSSMGFKYHMVIANTMGIIDSDYYDAKNEGHIMVKIIFDGFGDLEWTNTVSSFSLESGERFVQGIIKEYFVTCDDDAEGTRVDGMGSTGRK